MNSSKALKTAVSSVALALGFVDSDGKACGAYSEAQQAAIVKAFTLTLAEVSKVETLSSEEQSAIKLVNAAFAATSDDKLTISSLVLFGTMTGAKVTKEVIISACSKSSAYKVRTGETKPATHVYRA